MAQKLFEIRYQGKRIGDTGYALLSGACQKLKNAPEGSEVVQVDGGGNVLRSYSARDCEKKLRERPIIRSGR
jgi:hypothetical protein